MCPSCLCSCPSRQSTAQKPSTWRAVPMILAWTHFSLAPHWSNDGWSSPRSSHPEACIRILWPCVPVRVFFTTLSLGRNQRGVVTYHSCSLLDICLCIGSCPPQVSTGKLSLLARSSSVTALLTQPICLIHGPQNTSCYVNEACMPLLFFWILLSYWASWIHCLCSRTLSKAASSSHKLLLPLP